MNAVDDDLLIHPLRSGEHEVISAPRAALISKMVHGPWQIAATDLPASKSAFAAMA